MYKIDLRELDYYYINLPEHGDRSTSLLERLHRVNINPNNIERINGIRKEGIPQDQIYIGCFHSQLKALKHSVEKGVPFVILEDDAMINRFPDFLDIPDNACSVYIGVSKWGLSPQATNNLASYNSLIYDRFNEDFVRVYNMLSSHAILYIDMDYVKELINELERNLDGDVISSNSQNIPMLYYGGNMLPCDIIMSNMQSKFNIYGLRDPIFYQDDKHEYLL